MPTDIFRPRLSFNSNAKFSALQLGREKSNVLQIDGLLLNAEPVKAYAQACQDYTPPYNSFYPGLTAPVPEDMVLNLITALRKILRSGYGISESTHLIYNAFFGLVTHAHADLHPFQTLPHIDDFSRYQIAAVYYMCGTDHGGTAFYRQKRTGFERIEPDRLAAYNDHMQDELQARAGLAPAYFQDSDDDYEQIGKIDSCFNRMVVYPSYLLHSGLVNPGLLSKDPKKGRLTANFFFGISR
ncbi:DUF6445 family protein [Asticcacaulis sp. EMRT-3]|uniref:DUF6445 family protein n=1 Tax=Asticcacaulis sp. EMRT-3 TaxID=3040349 RepID=UPI0024AFE106|nr:DUF6445 family protein [Asticcacaulis sp. EMRT-3]MDI7774558.1 DUF6445 family protein [Asticcacaulis sp. EMRT-3]